MNDPLLVYFGKQLDPGSFGFPFDGTLVAAQVHSLVDRWRVDPLNEVSSSDWLPPFMATIHAFRSLPAALDWPVIHERHCRCAGEMKVRPVLLLWLGTGIVFGGVARILDAMGAENTIWICFFAAVAATVLVKSISR